MKMSRMKERLAVEQVLGEAFVARADRAGKDGVRLSLPHVKRTRSCWLSVEMATLKQQMVTWTLFWVEKNAANGENWGLSLGDGSSVDAEKLQDDGCQFLLIESDDVSGDVLLSEELGLGLTVEDGLAENRIRAIEDGPLRFPVLRTGGYQMAADCWRCPRTTGAVSSFSKHIFLSIPSGSALPGDKDLEVSEEPSGLRTGRRFETN